MKISIVFTRPKKWFSPYSWIIRAVEGSRFSHVLIEHGTSISNTMVLEAAGTRVRYLNKIYLKNIEIKKYSRELTSEQRKKFQYFIEEMAGKDYAWDQAAGIAISRMFARRHNVFSDGKEGIICSELIAWFIEEILEKPIENKDTLSPRDLEKLLERMIGWIKN